MTRLFQRFDLMNVMVPGLIGEKLKLENRLSRYKAVSCEPGYVENNGPLSFAGPVLLTISQLTFDQAKGIGLLEENFPALFSQSLMVRCIFRPLVMPDLKQCG